MIHAQTFKAIRVLAPVSTSAGASYDSSAIDTKGFDYCTIIVDCGAMQAALTECAITECATSGGTYTAIAALTVGNAACLDVEGTASALSDTDDNDTYVFHIDCRKRERFLKLNTTAASGGASVYAANGFMSLANNGGVASATNAALTTAGKAVIA
tara:strand:- start:1567 stop:2034 length:468 start_codon:yes stop_codon:yes gene_type:complete